MSGSKSYNKRKDEWAKPTFFPLANDSCIHSPKHPEVEVWRDTAADSILSSYFSPGAWHPSISHGFPHLPWHFGRVRVSQSTSGSGGPFFHLLSEAGLSSFLTDILHALTAVISSSSFLPFKDLQPHTVRWLGVEDTPHVPPTSPALPLPARREEPHLARFPQSLATLPGSLPAALLSSPVAFAPRSKTPRLCSWQPGLLLTRWERGGAQCWARAWRSRRLRPAPPCLGSG